MDDSRKKIRAHTASQFGMYPEGTEAVVEDQKPGIYHIRYQGRGIWVLMENWEVINE